MLLLLLLLLRVATVAASANANANTNTNTNANEHAGASSDESLEPLRVLLVATNRATLDQPDLPTGADAIELLDGFERLTAAGYAVEVASPRGGAIPLESTDGLDTHRKALLVAPTLRSSLDATAKIAEVDPSRYRAVYIVGGHGALWDLPQDEALHAIVLDLLRRGGVVGAVGHGVAALLEVKTGDTWLVADRTLTGATNAEEAAAGLLEQLPLSIQSTAGARGARWNDNAPGKPNVCVSRGVVTGQNAISAGGVVHFMLQLLEKGAVQSGR